MLYGQFMNECCTFNILQAVEQGYSMLLALMDPAPAHSELSTLKTNP